MREFKFFRGYGERTLTERFEELIRQYPITTPGVNWGGVNTIPNWGGTTINTPTWITNPGYIVPQPYTITTTPGTGTYTIPYSGTINTTTGFSLTTSNPNGITYTTTGMGGTLTTNTATYSSSSLKL
jgi:hypothetical protein